VGQCFRGRERRRTEPLAWVPFANAPSVGRFTGVFELRTTPTCTDSASPGLATVPVTGPYEPRQSPTRLVSGYSLRLSVLPNTAIPTRPTRPQCRRPSPVTHWIFRSALPFGKDSYAGSPPALLTNTRGVSNLYNDQPNSFFTVGSGGALWPVRSNIRN
jgi:hypothetical protein